MKLCAACHQDLPKDEFSKKQWKLGAQSQRRCTSCVRENREVVQPPAVNNEPDNDNTGIVSLLESLSMNENEMIPVSDEELFKEPPKEDCPICFLQMPSMWTGYKWMSCCGKVICTGCIVANSKLHEDDLCPFCRTPSPTTDKEAMMRNKKRVEMKDPMAMYSLGCKYKHGNYGLTQNTSKALELYQRAAELGLISAYYNIGCAYHNGNGVGRDKKKAKHYWELAAIGGNMTARYNLGIMEKKEGNKERALKHWMIAAGGGYKRSLNAIKELFMKGHTAKDDYEKALRGHQAYVGEIRSSQRDEAASFSDEFKYY